MVIDVRELEFRWQPDAPTVLSIDALQIGESECLFIKGPSGSGKSTLLSLLSGVTTAIAGTVRVMDHPDFRQRAVTTLSVGQQQRVAAARALMGSPELLIADEPTSSLDADRREFFIKLLFNECREVGATLIFVSHDASLEHLFDRTVDLAAINRAGQDMAGA